MTPAILGLGTAPFARGYGIGARTPEPEQAAALIRDAVDRGIRYLDTAAAYGSSESILGKAAADLERCHVRVATKTSATPSATPDHVAADVRSARDRLGLSALDTVLFHNADVALLGRPAVAVAAELLLAEKLAVRVGASTYGLQDARAAAATSWCSVVQVEHSILNPSVMAGLTRPRGIEVVVRSVLCKGLLTSRRREVPGLSAELAELLDELEALSRRWGYGLPELAIRFALDTPGVDVVIVGISTTDELETALRAQAHAPLDAERLRILRQFARSDDDATHPERWTSVFVDLRA